MTPAPTRTTADLSAFPNLVVIYLGMRVNSLRSVMTARVEGNRSQPVVTALCGLLD